MRCFILFFTFLLPALGVYAEKTVTTTIDAVTVYRQTARISHTGTVDIPVGTTEIVIDNLSAAIVLPSVQVQLDGNATILSVTSRINYNKTKPNAGQIEKYQDTLKVLASQLDWINNEKAIYEAEENVLNTKQQMVGTITGLPVAELEKLLTLYRSRLLDVRQKLFKLKGESKRVQERQGLVQGKINEINNQTVTPTGEVVVTVMAKVAGKSVVRCNYMVNNAGWSPTYDLRCQSIEKPVKINFYAQVYQSTGFDWKSVKLTVSTGNPSLNNSRPVLVPLYVDFYSPYIHNYQDKSAVVNSALYKEDVNNTDLSGPEYTVTVNETQLNAEYDIELAQSIPSDGKTRQVPLKDYDIPATYIYHTVPGMDNTAFLLAKITNWGQYNLLPGMANLFFEERYIGQSNINPLVTADTLLLSMGRDEKINIQRIPIIDKESHSFLGLIRKEKRTFEISLRNNKGRPITIEVLDQIPVSKQKDIKVELIDQGGAEYTAEIGKLLWTVDLKPGETKKLRFTYEVSFPKDKNVSGF